MSKLKVMTIVGTRPEIIRLSCVMSKLDEECEHVLVHTGQNYDYELSEIFFKELGLRNPDVFLDAAGANAAESIGKIIIAADRVLAKYNPEALLILGDTNSALSAIAAKRKKIPIFHMEAGNRCFDFRVPEEINRRIVDHVADINLTYSDIAREYLLREGLPPDQIIKTGSPMREVLRKHQAAISESNIMERTSVVEKKYFLVSLHREENVDSPENLNKIFAILNSLAQKYVLPVLVSTHPRTRKQIENLGLSAHEKVEFHIPFGFIDYVKLQTCALAVLSDSGTITEESSILNFPALNLRESHERPEGFEEGSVMMTGLSVERILQCLDILLKQSREQERNFRMVEDYMPSNVSDKVLRIILSYTDFVNRKVWQK